jgi:protein-serine/threonine kinase
VLRSHLVHASDFDQAEALLTRWGPEGLGKLGGSRFHSLKARVRNSIFSLDPRWANPIKDRIRENNQARAINEVVNALKPSQSKLGGIVPELRVVNGMSTATSSALTTAATENFRVSSVSPVDGLPGRHGNSTIRWGGGLKSHPEVLEHDSDSLSEEMDAPAVPAPKAPITPSLATLEKAVSARIYFENLYFPLFRHPPSREQRRLAMEKDMLEMQLNEKQKNNLRARWLQNETEYLRDKRRKVDASAFIKLKTIGHGVFANCINL